MEAAIVAAQTAEALSVPPSSWQYTTAQWHASERKRSTARQLKEVTALLQMIDDPVDKDLAEQLRERLKAKARGGQT